jgi:uncharacterized protein (TIGR00269 family)
MSSPVCRCGKKGFYLRRHSGEILCRKCFIKSVERIALKTIKRDKLLTSDDRIMIALSGGKDSVALIHILSSIERSYSTDLFAVTVDEGLRGYREEGLEISKRVTKELGIEHHVITFKEVYGHSLQAICKFAEDKGVGLLGCTFCGILRRHLLNDTAMKMNATKVATGHNLDDEAQTILINILRGDISRLARLGTKPIALREGFIPRVKPLRYVPEREIATYVYLKGYPLYERECPYVRVSLRDEVRDVLNDIEGRHPGTKFAIVKGADRISELLREKIMESEVGRCSRCGAPSSREVCRMCEILSMLGIDGSFINHLAE